MSETNVRPADPALKPTPEQLAVVARFLILSRRRRNLTLPALEFGEPAWDIVLELYVLQAEGRRISVSNLCDSSMIAESTALRWIRAMVGVGQLLRKPDTEDRRRIFVVLAPNLLDAVTLYLCEELRQLAPVIRSLWPNG